RCRSRPCRGGSGGTTRRCACRPRAQRGACSRASTCRRHGCACASSLWACRRSSPFYLLPRGESAVLAGHLLQVLHRHVVLEELVAPRVDDEVAAELGADAGVAAAPARAPYLSALAREPAVEALDQGPQRHPRAEGLGSLSHVAPRGSNIVVSSYHNGR